MLNPPKFSSALFSSDARAAVRNRWVAEQHFVYEKTNVADQILLSMHSKGPLVTSVLVPDETGKLKLQMCRTPAEQNNFYTVNRRRSQIKDAQIFTAFGTSWYGFVHGLITNQAMETGAMGQSEAVGLLPVSTDEDTIFGEIGFGRRIPSAADESPAAAIDKRLAMHRALENRVAALEARDLAALEALYTGDAMGSARDYPGSAQVALPSREALMAYHRTLFDSVKDIRVAVMHRLVEPWFALLELLWEGDKDGKRVRFRTADVSAVDSAGRISAQLGYGTAMEPVQR